MEDDRVSILEAQLAQAKMIAEDSDKKYEEVGLFSVIPDWDQVSHSLHGIFVFRYVKWETKSILQILRLLKYMMVLQQIHCNISLNHWYRVV